MEMLTILHSCIRDVDLQHFYLGNQIDWSQLLTPWIQCSHSTLRMQARFVLGYLRPGVTEDNLQLLNLDANDWKILMKMFGECCQPPDFITTMMGTVAPLVQQFRQLVEPISQAAPALRPSEDKVLSTLLQSLEYPLHSLSVTKDEIVASIDTTEPSYFFSASEIMNALENMLSMESNLQAFCSFDFLPHVKAVLSHGGNKERIAACRLLWSLALLGCSSLEEELKDQYSALSLSLIQLQSQENHELQLLIKCITAKLQGGDTEGEEHFIVKFILDVCNHSQVLVCVCVCVCDVAA